MVSPTTVKSNSVAHAKMRRFTERKDRSICVQMKKRIKLNTDIDKSLVEELIKGIHSGIEHVYFPRQRMPRFFFVLCKDDEIKKEVSTAIHLAKCAELGPLFPKKVTKKEFIVQEPEPRSRKQQTTVDPTIIILEGLSKTLKTETIKKEFPKCKDTLRFNNARCYVIFKNIQDSYAALQRVKNEPTFCGFENITARFNKVTKAVKVSKQHKKVLPNND